MANSKQAGFTLMEIVVATTIFAGTVTLMLTLFNYTLQINRRVQAMRQVAQGTRNFTETIAREIRNGRIDYDVATMDPACNPNGYGSIENTSLGLVNVAGEKVCFYFDQNASPSGGALYISKSGGGETVREVVNPPNFWIVPKSMHFFVRPTSDPNPSDPSDPRPGLQPFATITAEFVVQLSARDPMLTIPYQTTISTDVYDIYHF